MDEKTKTKKEGVISHEKKTSCKFVVLEVIVYPVVSQVFLLGQKYNSISIFAEFKAKQRIERSPQKVKLSEQVSKKMVLTFMASSLLLSKCNFV